MENYIKKINDKIIASGNEKSAKRVKFAFQLSGGLLIAFGLAGFLASFITFMVLFFKFKTDDAFIAWMVAVPFLVMIVAGSVLARIGDALLPKDMTSIDNFKNGVKETFKFDKGNKEEKTDKKKKDKPLKNTEADKTIPADEKTKEETAQAGENEENNTSEVTQKNED